MKGIISDLIKSEYDPIRLGSDPEILLWSIGSDSDRIFEFEYKSDTDSDAPIFDPNPIHWDP